MVLGPLVISHEQAPLAVAALSLRRLLAGLLCRAGTPVGPAELADAVWDGAPPPSARRTMQVHIHRLRRLLDDPERIRYGPAGYQLEVAPAELDTLRFADLIERGRAARRHGDLDRANGLLTEALGLWRGSPYADVTGGRLITDEVARLVAQRASAHRDLLEVELDRRQHHQVVPALTALVEAEPYHERLRALLMLALYRCGRQADALAVFRQTRILLARELAVEPGQMLQQLHRGILHADRRLGEVTTADLDDLVTAAAPATGQDPAARRVVPRQLPGDTAGFTGRDDALRLLDRLLPDRAPGGGVTGPVVISAIAGTAGVGKTALAVHWAHRVAAHFPDGQLYLNLRGYATIAPLQPIEALASLLRSLGTPPDQIPVDEEQAASLYRSQLAGRRVLVVLDNARSTEQVRPLLPGSDGCLVVTTSRDRLAGLVTHHGAHRLDLDAMTQHEASSLLTTVLGSQRTGSEPEATRQLAAVCARLPLALRIAAANLRDHPHRSIAAQVAALSEGNRLATLQVDHDPQSSIQVAYDLSYLAVPADAQRLFRFLGLIPGTDVTSSAAAALLAATPERTEVLLDRLASAHLVQEQQPGRYTFHDLLRTYARERALDEDGWAECSAALDRLMHWYLHTAAAAADLRYPLVTIRLPRPPVGAGLHPTRFADSTAAAAWLESERNNLVAAARHAAEHGPWHVAWLLADTLRGYFWQTRYAPCWAAVAESARTAARRADDRRARAATELSLGDLNLSLARYPTAESHYGRALELLKATEWEEGRAAVLCNLGIVHWTRGRLRRATDAYAEALRVYQRDHRPASQAAVLTNLGCAYRVQGRLTEAAEHHRAALLLFRKTGSDREAAAHGNLGKVEHDRGRLTAAADHLTVALDLYRQRADRSGAADSGQDLAALHRDLGRYDEARTGADAALALAQQVGDHRIEADALNTAGSIHLALGLTAQAAAFHHEAHALARRTGTSISEPVALLGLAAAANALGDLEQAAAQALHALRTARAVGYRMLVGQALTLLAEVRSGTGDLRGAQRYLRGALRVHRLTGHRLGEARSLLIASDLSVATGEISTGESHRRAACALFAEIGAPGPAPATG